MKGRISATIDKETERVLEELLKDGKYRNKSHIIEKALELLMEKEKDGKKE